MNTTILLTLNWIKHDGYQEIKGDEWAITLEPRPGYCDRGNFLAKIWPTGELAREIDSQDGWPRYYFDETRAKLEIEAWLEKRNLLPKE